MRRGALFATGAAAATLVLGCLAAVAGAAAPGRDTADDGGGRVRSAKTRGPAAAPAASAPDLSSKLGGLAASEGGTRCGACHRVEGWEKVRFNHDPTGFPLRGAHTEVTCAACHGNRFDTPVSDTCAGCHRDRHGGEFGMHCEGCHEEKSWRPLLQTDAHRRTNFPLVGKHALIPCQECHGNLRDRTFARAASTCDSCHEPEFMRTGLTSIDHTAAGYSRQCQQCHNTFRFFPVSVAAHDTCWRVSGGSHHGIRCLGCHTSLASGAFNGTCATGTFTCSECHDHACTRTENQHKKVMGYACADPKCYECHKLVAQ